MIPPSHALFALLLTTLTSCLFPSAERRGPTSFRASSASSPVVIEIASTSRTLGRNTIDFQLISLVDATWVSVELELPSGVRLVSQQLPNGPLAPGDKLSGTATFQLPPAVYRGKRSAEIILTALLDKRTADDRIETVSSQSTIRFGCHEASNLVAHAAARPRQD